MQAADRAWLVRDKDAAEAAINALFAHFDPPAFDPTAFDAPANEIACPAAPCPRDTGTTMRPHSAGRAKIAEARRIRYEVTFSILDRNKTGRNAGRAAPTR